MDEVTVECWDDHEAAGFLDAILPAYEEVYAAPPYCEGPRDVADFMDRFRAQATRPGIRMAVAHADDEVVGFSFGYLLAADTRWWAGMLEPLPQDVTRETGRRTFAIIELAVRAPWRRQGIARRLHAALLDGVDVERVTLTVRPEPEADPARKAYASWGYQVAGRSQPWDEAPIYDAMILPLRQE